MNIVVATNTNVLLYIGGDNAKIDNDNNIIDFGDVVYSSIGVSIFNVNSIPNGVIPNEYCYTTTNGFTLNPNYIPVINGIPQTLTVVQDSQKQLITDAYNNALSTGFTSSASGTATQYPYNPTAEQTFDELYLALMSNKVNYPCNVYDINDNAVAFANSTQLTQIFTDIFTFKAGLNTKMHGYLSQIDACTDVASVQAIVWS
jgi:hypothetical protein